MKLFLNLCGIILAGILGYSLEPNLRVLLTGQAPGKSEKAANGRVIVQMGDSAEKIDLESLKPEQLPAMVRISSGLEVADSATGITMNIPAGNNVKLVSIEGANAIVSQGGTYVGKIPVMETDLLERLAEIPSTPAATVPTTGDSAEPPAMPEPPPVPEPAPEPEIAANDPATAQPEPAVPAGEPAAPAAPTGGPVDVVQTMQESVKSGQIKEFKFDQVTEWKAGEPETVDGESLETGTALYKAVTFLGEKTIEAKAFIKGGKVQRWIWPRSGMEIK
ncbi:MAG: hypothetical protein V4640_02290 [Verrucomicrobiota bacterium]